MCGIIFELCLCKDSSIVNQDPNLIQRIKNRGPNDFQSKTISIDNKTINFFGSVLWMQGSHISTQPIENERGIMLYNGDIFNDEWQTLYGDLSDTKIILQKLSQTPDNQTIIEVIKSLKGPFSLIYFDKINKSIYFARDKIGRNSLLLHVQEKTLVISNVLGRQYECVEIPATHIYELNMVDLTLNLHSWHIKDTTEVTNIYKWHDSIKLKQDLPDENVNKISANLNTCLEQDKNVDFVHFVGKLAEKHNSKQKLMVDLLNNEVLLCKVKDVVHLLDKSVKIRIETQPSKCKACVADHTVECNHSSTGILFSGGLDCTILAFLANKYVPSNQSIDLINVAFKKDNKSSYDVPDRMTGNESYHELQRVCSSRKWIFREINVPYNELKHYQETIIGDLVYPRKTILDESLGSALWFASKAHDINNETSQCRVLLLGSGADELFGGYSRHKNAFKRNGWPGLHKEMLLDWTRISFRNLARDNRVICDNGRQPRMPYLDEDFCDYVLKLEPWFKCYPCDTLGQGVGDKLLLRLVAYYLGLTDVSTFPKRALQFGSRIANKKEKGSDISKTFNKDNNPIYPVFYLLFMLTFLFQIITTVLQIMFSITT